MLRSSADMLCLEKKSSDRAHEVTAAKTAAADDAKTKNTTNNFMVTDNTNNAVFQISKLKSAFVFELYTRELADLFYARV
ncbi:jg26840 [Pararge aegeria aegeria]|uniref:Jg26840 protein n=1 Tax=Pararge aegeria aegeria TaxID=348720 RepID=A0A8S4SK63_9NEOP|nr:jg26840 [Pararge aegeria aegeria]